MHWWPRSIRWQLFLGLVLLEALSVGLFALLLAHFQRRDVHERARLRLLHQANALAMQAEEALSKQQPDWVLDSVRMMGDAPSVLRAKVTDPAGNVLCVSAGEPSQHPLDPAERAEIARGPGRGARVFSFGSDRWEGVKAIYVGSDLRGYAWVETDRMWDREQLIDALRATLIFGVVWILASAALILLISRLISRPLAILHGGTRALMSLPEGTGSFPLPVSVDNEFGDLIQAFNRMVASLEEQRSGLNDTLSLLDSMLANAPVGMAFFDRHLRCVRVNQVYADLTGAPVSRHLGKTLADLMAPDVAEQLEAALRRVFSDEAPEGEIELQRRNTETRDTRTWLVSVYPVRTSPERVRWAGVIMRDVSERVRAEETLRKTEKLAATGRLAASIAHEINNPLEALTNLLFLLRNFSGLDQPALHYVTMAEHEARRITEIAQQTLRFYRQSTFPARASMAELIDSVLDLYRSKLIALDIDVKREYDSELTLFCYSGEVRQVIANLVGNAVDAISNGGCVTIRARRSQDWKSPQFAGIRFTVADSGSGMDAGLRERIFEAFFTTKEDTGTGLGLWVSEEIVLKHHGFIRVRSRTAAEGHPSGTVFQIFLPDDENLVRRAHDGGPAVEKGSVRSASFPAIVGRT